MSREGLILSETVIEVQRPHERWNRASLIMEVIIEIAANDDGANGEF